MRYTKEEQRAIAKLTKNHLKEEISKGTAKDVVDELKKILVFHEWRYYVLNDPLISDFEYDTLYKKLEKLEVENPELISPESPTQRVSNDLTTEFNNVPHLIPMLSLANSYNAEDLNDFDTQIKKLINQKDEGDIEYCVEPKFDGGSIALIYTDDKLERAATRGNGTNGEEVTTNARVIKTIPLAANFSKKGLKTVELRGEVLIRKDIFDKMNKQREKDGQDVFANPRNTAAGGMRMKDPKEVAGRGLEAFIYQVGYAIDDKGKDQLDTMDTQFGSINYLSELGFKVPTVEKKLCKNIGEVIKFVESWGAKREKYPYEIDGMVVKVNDFNLQKKCGATNHHPRWAIAYKFKAKQATAKLLTVEYQVGKIGAVTPVAKIEPTQLAGVTISSISMHNEDFIKGKDIRLGDSVLIERAGDVIPYIVKSLPDLRDGSEQKIKFPTNCPSCQTILTRQEKEAVWRCENPTCEAQVLQRMIHHVSKDAMDIDGFGKSYVERFFELGWLQNNADIYKLNYDAISQLEGFGERSASKLKKAINKAKKNPIHRVLYSLSIHHFGRKASKLIAQEIKHILELKDWTEENFTEIKDIGPVVTQNVIAYFSDPKNIQILEEMESLGVNFNQTDEDRPLEIDEDAIFFGKTILFTGTLQKMGRKEAQQLAANAGAKNISAVSSNLNILVAGEKAGSKLKKATALGTVQILTEDEFLKLIES